MPFEYFNQSRASREPFFLRARQQARSSSFASRSRVAAFRSTKLLTRCQVARNLGNANIDRSNERAKERTNVGYLVVASNDRVVQGRNRNSAFTPTFAFYVTKGWTTVCARKKPLYPQRKASVSTRERASWRCAKWHEILCSMRFETFPRSIRVSYRDRTMYRFFPTNDRSILRARIKADLYRSFRHASGLATVSSRPNTRSVI